MLAQVDASQQDIYSFPEAAGTASSPADQPAWKAALQQALTADQNALWARTKIGEEKKRRDEIAGAVNTMAANSAEQQRPVVESEISKVNMVLNLPPDRLQALKGLAETSVRKYQEDTRRADEKMVLAMSEIQRQQILKAGGRFGMSMGDGADSLVRSFRAAVNKMLSADERQRLETARKAQADRQAHVLGQVLLVVLDDKLALTAAQRQRLGPLADRVAKANHSLESIVKVDSYGDYISSLYQAAGTASEAELSAILDSDQISRWKDIKAGKNTDDEDNEMMVARPASPASSQAPPVPEPELVEHSVSAYLAGKSEKKRQRLLAACTLKAEDARRVCALSSEASGELQVAARGFTEDSMAQWNSQITERIRSFVANATPENIQSRLDSIQSYYFSDSYNQNNGSAEKSVWDEAVAAQLNTAQQAAWKKETDARKKYRDELIVDLLTARLENAVPLKEEQHGKVRAIIAKVLQDYAPELENFFSGNSGTPWFLSGYYNANLPLAGLPQPEMKTLLSDEQWKEWSGSPLYINALSNWSNVEQMHQQRVKQQARNTHL